MAHHLCLDPPADDIPPSPFDPIDNTLDRDDFREVAYEVFFTACRSSPGFAASPSLFDEAAGGDAASASTGTPTRVTTGSRWKRTLGLKMLRRPASRRSSSCGGSPLSSPVGSPKLGATLPARMRRPMTPVEIVRHQMRVTEQSDNRLRKTLMRTLVGQMGRPAETIILPLELLRHLKPSEFDDAKEYHQWQKRQLKILNAGLLLCPFIPLNESDDNAAKLREIIEESEAKAIDTGKNSETMRTLCNCVVSLAWRTPDDGATTDVCHWADGYPLNVELYMSLLHSIFDVKDETLVLDEVDELLELIKKTWSILGICRAMHNLCLAWKLFEQFFVTGQIEMDLLSASLTMLTEVASDAKRTNREPIYVKMLGSVLSKMKKWCEERLLDYHTYFNRATAGVVESILPIVFSLTAILEDDVPDYVPSCQELEDAVEEGSKINYCIRSSSRNAFAKMVKIRNGHGAPGMKAQKPSDMLVELARETEELALKEREVFSPVLKKWYPLAAGASTVTLHACYGALLKEQLASMSHLMNDTILVLQRAGKLENALIQMVVEDSAECEDGGKAIVTEMTPYDVDSVIDMLLKEWIDQRLRMGKENLQRAKESETWNPKSKTEPYAQSATEMIKFAKECVESFFHVPMNIPDTLVHDLADGLDHLLSEYATFIASCGSKQSYLPSIPPLTRCSRDSRIHKLWKIAACSVGIENPDHMVSEEGNHPRPSTSRGTQRLYIRLNTLHYLLLQLHSLDKALTLSPKIAAKNRSRKQPESSYFEKCRAAIHEASQHVSEVAAYRLIFLDSNSFFYGSLYAGDVGIARIRPALRILKQNITLLCAIVTERAQPLALKELMKATFEAYLMVLLAGGSSRIFSRFDHLIIEEDFLSLKRLFLTCTEGLVGEDELEREAEIVEGVVDLMGESTEQLVEEFSIVASEANSGAAISTGQKMPMPPMPERWHRSDPHTILRVLCYRNDRVANHFLKRTFQLAKRSISG